MLLKGGRDYTFFFQNLFCPIFPLPFWGQVLVWYKNLSYFFAEYHRLETPLGCLRGRPFHRELYSILFTELIPTRKNLALDMVKRDPKELLISVLGFFRRLYSPVTDACRTLYKRYKSGCFKPSNIVHLKRWVILVTDIKICWS